MRFDLRIKPVVDDCERSRTFGIDPPPPEVVQREAPGDPSDEQFDRRKGRAVSQHHHGKSERKAERRVNRKRPNGNSTRYRRFLRFGSTQRIDPPPYARDEPYEELCEKNGNCPVQKRNDSAPEAA